jgi:hypothetical protein
MYQNGKADIVKILVKNNFPADVIDIIAYLIDSKTTVLDNNNGKRVSASAVAGVPPAGTPLAPSSASSPVTLVKS